MKNEIIFIFGGSGLIGITLIKKLLTQNIIIVNFDQKKTIFNNKNYNYINVNLENLNQLKKKITLMIKKVGCPIKMVNCSYPNKSTLKNKLHFKKINLNELTKTLTGHLGSYILSSTMVLNEMRKGGMSGSIVLLSSIYGLKAQDLNIYKNTKILDSPIYATIKGAINAYVKSACSMYAKNNININSLCPGGIENIDDKNFIDKQFYKNYISKVPAKRFANPEEISETILFLLDKKKSGYINGTNLPIDGGMNII